MGVTGIVHTRLLVSDPNVADNGCSGAKAVYDIGLDRAQPARRS